MEPSPVSIQANGWFYTCDKLSWPQWSRKYSRAHTYLEGSEPAVLLYQIKARFIIALVRLLLWEIGHWSLDDTTTFVVAFPPAVITSYDQNNSTNRTIASNILWTRKLEKQIQISKIARRRPLYHQKGNSN